VRGAHCYYTSDISPVYFGADSSIPASFEKILELDFATAGVHRMPGQCNRHSGCRDTEGEESMRANGYVRSSSQGLSPGPCTPCGDEPAQALYISLIAAL
jgi:hypothetical protein